MICPACSVETDAAAEACFTCGMALHVLTQGAVLAGRYEIVSPLGQGGMGRVYKAFDRVLEEHVALKVLRPEFAAEPDMARRFLSEIKLARKVSHPNVCRIHEYGEDGGHSYISMELIDGVSLKEHLRQQKLTVADAFDLALGVARGLQAVHERGIIHRDFKTSNIMVDSRGRVRLLDFGIARVAGADTGTFTAAGHVMGTPEYMSPEQAMGARLDFRSDIYALGCVVFEIFSGQAVFQGETPLVTLFKHINEAPPLEAAWGPIPPALVPPLRSALAKDPAGRYQTVALFASALEEARTRCVLDAPTGGPSPDATSVTASPETATIHRPDLGPMETAPYRGTGRPTARRDKRVWAAAALAVAAGAGVLWMRDLAPSAPRAMAVSPAPAAAAGTAPLDAPSPPLPVAAGQRPLAAPGPTSATPASTPRPSPLERRPSATPDPMPAGRAPALGDATTGTLRLVVVPPAEVTVDGQLVGTVSAQTLRLPPGRHVVRFLHPDYKPLQRTVTVTPGGTVELPIDLAEKAIRIPR